MSTPLEQSFWMLAGLTAKSAVVLTAAMLAAESCRRGSAALRHALRSLGILAALLLPLIAVVVPSWEWRILPATSTVPTITTGELATAPAEPAARPAVQQASKVSADTVPATSVPAAPVRDASEPVSSANPWPRIQWNWTWTLLVVWLGGFLLLTIRLLIGITRAHGLLGLACRV